MGLVLAFLVGYAAGARGSTEDFDEVVAAARQVMASQDVKDLVRLVRRHLGVALGDLGGLVATGDVSAAAGNVLERVQALVDRRPTST